MEAVRSRATGMVRGQQADAVLLCQRSETADEILWMEHRGREVSPVNVGHTPLAAAELLEETTPPQQLQFLDGFYRSPLPPCRVWLLEVPGGATPEPEIVRPLLDLSRLGARDPRVAGLSVYRVAGAPALVIAFLALAPALTPAEYLMAFRSGETTALDKALACHPLCASWTVGRLATGPGPRAATGRYPRAAFWARAGFIMTPPVGLPSAMQEAVDGAGHPRRAER